jgi:hypothetical protein
MRELCILVLVSGFAFGAGAALTFVNAPTEPLGIGQTTTITIHSTTRGNYSGWLEIADPTVATFAAPPIHAGRQSGWCFDRQELAGVWGLVPIQRFQRRAQSRDRAGRSYLGEHHGCQQGFHETEPLHRRWGPTLGTRRHQRNAGADPPCPAGPRRLVSASSQMKRPESARQQEDAGAKSKGLLLLFCPAGPDAVQWLPVGS